ncbi:TetR family transcriptional regulator [Amycolatopsis minnesotensis]
MSTDGLRERKKRETRIALSWAAVRLVVERGVANVKVEDIAAEAGVSLRTFRNYFANKAEAIAARHLDRALEIAEELRLRPAEEPLWTAIVAAVEDRFPLGLANGGEEPPDQQWVDGVRLMVAEPSLRGEMLRANAVAEVEMAAAIAERTGTDATRDLYPKLVAAAVGAAVTVTMAHWLEADSPLAMKPLLRDALTQFSAGLPEPGPR